MKNKKRTQTGVGLNMRTYILVKALSDYEKRPLCRQIEILAERECRRLGIPVPETNEKENVL